MEWTSDKLSSLVEIILGRTPSRRKSIYWGEGTPWVSISDLKDKYISDTKEQITGIGAKDSRSRLIPRGTLMMSFKLSIGKLAFSNTDLYTNEAIASFPVKDNKKIDEDYLYYVLQNIPLIGGNQAVMGQTLNKTSLSDLEIPYPKSIIDQKSIAQVLNDCEDLITKRKESLSFLDELVRSTFLEMFGDPIRNSKNLEIKKLSELTKLSRGKFTPRPRNDPKYFGGKYPFVQTGDINRAGDYLINYTQTLNDLGVLVSKEFKKGTILIALVGATIGETTILGMDAFTTDSVVGINPRSKLVTPRYLEMILRFWKPILRSKAPEAARANINNETLKPIPIPIPLPEDLKVFTEISEKLEDIKEIYLKHLTELENLYGRLSQDAFKGELDLSGIVLREGTDETLNRFGKEINTVTSKKYYETLQKSITELELTSIIKSYYSYNEFVLQDLLKVVNKELGEIDRNTINQLVKKLMDDKVVEENFSGSTRQIIFKLVDET